MPTQPRRKVRFHAVVPFLAVMLLGGAGLLSAQTTEADPRLAPLCTPDAHTLCLASGRFSATAFYQLSPSGPSIEATAVALTDATGYFWFFDAANVELTVKVLDGCGVNGFYWVFASGMTNVGVNLTVTDLRTGEQQVYENPVGTPFVPIQDTAAFHTCP